jgi:hypothetical protein
MLVRTMKPVLLSAALLVAAGPGCATTRVATDHDPNANFAGFRTFAVKTGQVVNNGVVDPRDTLVRDRIDSAITNQFANKGMQPSIERPDLIVTYTAGARTRAELDLDPLDSSSPNYHDLDWSDTFRSGTIVIDVIDANTRKLVWRSVASADNQNFRSADFINKAVAEALENYPSPVQAT